MAENRFVLLYDFPEIGNGEEWNDRTPQVPTEDFYLEQYQTKRFETNCITVGTEGDSKAIWAWLSQWFAGIQPFREDEQNMSGIIPTGKMCNNTDSFHDVKKNNG